MAGNDDFQNDGTDVHGNHADVGNAERTAREFGDRIRGFETQSRVHGDEAHALRSVQHNEFATGEGGDSGSAARNRRDRERAVRDLMNQLALIDQRIEWLEQRIEQLENQLTAIERLEALGDNLDPTNPQHAALLRAAGIDPATVNPDDPQAAIRTRRTEIETEIDQHEDEIDRLRERRSEYEAEVTRGRAVEADVASASTIAEVERIVEEAPLADAATAAAQSDSDEVTAAVHSALGESEEDTEQYVAMESLGASGDLSFMMDGPPPTVSAATELGEETPIQPGEDVQRTVKRH